jgi:serine/threonine-protein kinase HipA
MTAPAVTRLDVFYKDDGEAERVGGLAADRSNGRVYFQYDVAWLATGRELSPIQLPREIGTAVVSSPDPRKLHGLFGLFADALPDSWGMRVLDLALRRRGVDIQRLGPLDRLAFLGEHTMGALSFAPAIEWADRIEIPQTVDRLDRVAEQIYENAHIENGADIDALELAVGSAGGAQPKALHALDGRPQLIKFTPRRAGLGLRTDCGQIEEAYARMARAADIRMEPTRLLQTSDGRSHFAAERFDRTAAGGRRHVHTFGGLLGREAAGDADYDDLLRYARGLTGDARVIDEILRRLAFNLATLNDDDHLKNVAFLLDPREGWTLAPAYDLTYAPARARARGMSVAGHGVDATWSVVEALGAKYGVKAARARAIRDEVESRVAEWPAYAAAVGLGPATIEELATAFAERSAHLSVDSLT